MLPHAPEQRGARKRARAAATQLRRSAQLALESSLSTPPPTSQAAALRWDHFYSTKPNLFKDRHLLRAQFPDLMPSSVRQNPSLHHPPLSPLSGNHKRDPRCNLTLVEAGCGVGNGVFPMLRANDTLFAYAFDYSAKAVELLQACSEYRTDRVFAFQADLSEPSTYVNVVKQGVPQGADFVTAVWTLSALPPGEQQARAVSGLASMLKPGGIVFVRDYAAGDMRQHSFEKRGRKVGGRLFLRGDGTYAYFFEVNELGEMFERVGLIREDCQCVEREVRNRKEGIVMARRWVHAKFRKPEPQLCP